MPPTGLRLIVASLVALPLSNGPSGPVPPCGTPAVPPYGAVDAAPAVRHWEPADVATGWKFPACVPWTTTGFSSMVTIAGRFRHSGDADALLERYAQISKLQGVKYWSKTNGRWQTFIEDATALSAPDRKARRADFTPNEIRSGETVHVFAKDNTAGNVVYRLRVHEASPNRIVVGMENATSVKKFMKTILHVNDAQTLYFLNRESSDVWSFYFIMRISDRASSLATGSPQSAINRAMAYYRHFAGIPTDMNPPAAK
jgi:hypothetical protein